MIQSLLSLLDKLKLKKLKVSYSKKRQIEEGELKKAVNR